MRILRTNDGTEFKVSDEDASFLSRSKWRRSSSGYVVTSVRLGKKVEHKLAQRLIAGAKPGQRVALKDGDPLNLCRGNLVVLGRERTVDAIGA